MRRVRACVLSIAAPSLSLASAVRAQGVGGDVRPGPVLVGEGWRGFGNFDFLAHALLALLLATALGAVIAYHPRRQHTVDSLAAAEFPKVLMLYVVIGAVIGIVVVQYGLVAGFVIFGIGGLTRFRTVPPSPPDTGRLIFVTLIGLAAGLQLPHLAVLTTLFGVALLAVLDARVVYQIVVMGMDRGVIGRAATAYRDQLEQAGCRVLGERKNVGKEEITLIVRAPRGATRAQLTHRLETQVPEALRGTLNWEVD